jgi:hypothetical protein
MDHAEAEMGDVGRRDHPLRFQRDRVERDAVEEADAAAEEDRHDVHLHDIEQTGPQVLLSRLAAAGDEDVLVTRGRARLLERRLDALGDEDEVGSALHRLGLARVMREHEDRAAERRLVAPPAVGPRIVLPGASAAAEHLAAHHDGAGRRDAFGHDLVVAVRLAAGHAVVLAEGFEPEDPFVQPLAANAERLLERRAGPGHETVERHRDIQPDLRHRQPLFFSRWQTRRRPARELIGATVSA